MEWVVALLVTGAALVGLALGALVGWEAAGLQGAILLGGFGAVIAGGFVWKLLERRAEKRAR